VVISIPQTVTVQEAQELARAVQQVMEIKRFGIDCWPVWWFSTAGFESSAGAKTV